jgi:acyl-coenzyme A thioesterase PaaI-like protein
LKRAQPPHVEPADPDALRRERAARRTAPLRNTEQATWQRLSDAIRRQIRAVVEQDADEARLRRLAEQAEALAEALEESASGKRVALVDSAWETEPGEMSYLPFSPIMGRLNPASIGVVIRREGEKVVSELRLAEPVEGATGLVHGGVIAGIYDEVLAAANLMIKAGGPTGTLTVRYRRPTPLYSLLRFEGWVERIDDRKVHTRGHCLAGEQVVSEAEAIFVRFAPDRKIAGWQPPETGRD